MFEDDIAKLQKKIDPSGTLNLVQSLDKTLQRMNVKRQAYNGKSFVGNHVHKCLQDGNIDMLTNAVIEEVKAVSPEYQDEATTICTKFNKLLKMFAKCHAGYSKCDYMEAEEIKELETNIDCLMAFYREQFPNAKVSPKMHILEDHTVPWIQKWGFGCGFHGEQGGEHVHADLNNIRYNVRGLKDDLEITKCVMKEHWTQVSPTTQKFKPEAVKKRCKTSM
ncbi:uncharacterized protein [Ptychodera flava]|uniref:uncharacterized protein n=1 Tax=Ptychodera flava TaxID=63121 RepID=UPI00396A0499